MYARLIMLKLGPGDRAAAESVADAAAKIYRASPGFKSVTFFADEAAGNYGALSVWESQETLDAAAEKANPLVAEKVGKLLKSPPAPATYEVYEPRA